MTKAADGFQLPSDPRELLNLLDTLRIRVLAFTETLHITDEEIDTLSTDYAALTETIRTTEAAEALARDWREFQTRLLRGEPAAISPPETAIIPPLMGVGGAGSIVREAWAGRNSPVHAGVAGRLQRFVDRLLAHPDTTDRTLIELGLLPGATIGFSPGQPREAGD